MCFLFPPFFSHFFLGRIPGAVNVPYKTLIDVASGGYWPLPKLKQKLDECGLSLSRARALSLALALALALSSLSLSRSLSPSVCGYMDARMYGCVDLCKNVCVCVCVCVCTSMHTQYITNSERAVCIHACVEAKP